MKKIKVAFVSDAIYPYNKGGKETRLFEISTRLAKKGYQVDIYCMNWWNNIADREENGVHLHAISPYIPLYDGPRRSIKQGVLFGLACFKLLFADYDLVDVDHMPFFPIFSMKIVTFFKRKTFFGTWNEVWGEKYWQEYLPGLKGKIAALIEKISVKLPDKIISISPMTRDSLISTFDLPKDKIITLPCGYNLEQINSAPASELNSDVIFIGRLLKHKNVDVLLKSIERLKNKFPNIVCRIVGTGPEEESLRNLTKELKIEKSVFFHGKLNSHRDVFSLMKSAKVLVLPSTREGFGIVVLEAHLCGLNVITTDHKDNAAKFLISEGKNGSITSLSESSLEKHIEKYVAKKIPPILDKGEVSSWEDVCDQYISKVLNTI